MQAYPEQVLRKLQLKELDIMKEFDALCQKHDIPYVFFYGSSIGAVRHGGFIPWDDDVDLLLLRKDYERFCRVAKEEYGDTHYLLTAEEDENYPLMTAHWGPKDTEFVISEFKNVPCKQTIFLDIFPLDTISDDPKARRKQALEAWFWQKLMLLRQMPHPASAYRGAKRTVFYLACGVIHFGMKLLHISPRWLYRRCKAACLRYEGTQSQEVAFLTDTNPGTNVFRPQELFPARRIPFEGTEFPFPKENDALLTRCYGDYMQLPPEEDRRNHFPYLLDFGDGERYRGEETD